MAGSNSNYSILVDVQLQEESIKKQLKEIQNNKDTKLNIGVTADGAERTKKELDGVTQSTKNLNTETETLIPSLKATVYNKKNSKAALF